MDDPTQNNNVTPPSAPPPQQPQQPIVAGDYTHPILDKPKRVYHPKVTIIALSAVVTLALIGVGLAIYFALQPVQPGQTNKNGSTNNGTTKTPTLTAAQEIERLKVYFKGTDKARTSLTTPIRTEGNNFYTVIPDASQVTSIAGELEPAKVADHLTAMHKVLDYDKFTRKILQDGVGTNNYLADYIHADVICQLSATKQTDPKANQFVEAKCLNLQQYVDYATVQRTFYNVYPAGDASSVPIVFTGKPQIKASVTAGYQFTELPVSTVIDQQATSSGTLAMFYKTPDNIWHHFKDRAQRLVECEQYNTDPLRYAYAGQPCHSLGKDVDLVVEAPKKKK